MRQQAFLFIFATMIAVAVMGNGRIDARDAANYAVHQERIPDFDEVKFADRKDVFIDYMLPRVEAINKEILIDRQHLQSIYTHWDSTKSLDFSESQWFFHLSKKYRLRDADIASSKSWDALMKRVDVIPPAMVLAQAALESGWGTHRFAKQGNNFFGLRCFSHGCGMIPKKRSAGQKYEVRHFSSVKSAIRTYMHTLNVNRAYNRFRDKRFAQRETGQNPTGYHLIGSLLKYSELGNEYIVSVRNVIKSNFAELDQG